jgi:hypothetical protein
MDRRFAFLFVVLVAAGCKQDPYMSAHLEVLGSERRALEDRVIDLEIELERSQKRLKEAQEDGSGSSSRRTRDTGSQDTEAPVIEIPGLDDDLPSILRPPPVDEGQPADRVLPSPNGDSARKSPRYQLPTRPINVTSRAPGDPRITHIELNPILTGGIDLDNTSGDDGLTIVLEPRNADNEFVPLAGPITVVLLDYAKRSEGSAALIARWKIDAPTVHKSIVNDEYGRGIQLRLPWSDGPPENSKLRLDIRYTTVDGRHLDAQADVFVTLPGQSSARWTPRAPRSSNGYDRAPHDGQPPVNIARQPSANKSAGSRGLPKATRAAFTIAPAAAEPVFGDTPGRTASSPGPPESNRPTWQPYR